MLVQH